jgi:hypothetical protein
LATNLAKAVAAEAVVEVGFTIPARLLKNSLWAG